MSTFRQIPSVDRLLGHLYTEGLIATYGREWVTQAVREVLTHVRDNLQEGQALPNETELLDQVYDKLQTQAPPTLQPVINATGVLIHTNLGRAPLSKAAIEAMEAVAAGYSNLEYDLAAGKRGKRDLHAEAYLTRLTGAEAALVVNNNAGGVLLALTALARRKQVAVSRTQLVEIGGGFRIPDVLRASGAHLLEVGTTNRTHLTDYQEAIAAGASLLLLTHHSNFKIIGFTTEPTLSELVELAHDAGLPLVFDLGSGALLDTAKYGLAHELTVQEAVATGANLVCVSGDKLLGGPQAGIIVGKKQLVQKLRRHALYRALRPDKLCLSALSVTLLHYLKGEAEQAIPIYQMLNRSAESLQAQAKSWQQKLGVGEILPGYSTVGGGSLPEETLPTWLLALEAKSPQKLLAALRACQPPIIARIENDRVVLDPRTIQPEEEEVLLAGLQSVIRKEDQRK
jgi:L-seryl-tRNA(Ser) seleniumtransferase